MEESLPTTCLCLASRINSIALKIKADLLQLGKAKFHMFGYYKVAKVCCAQDEICEGVGV